MTCTNDLYLLKCIANCNNCKYNIPSKPYDEAHKIMKHKHKSKNTIRCHLCNNTMEYIYSVNNSDFYFCYDCKYFEEINYIKKEVKMTWL